MKSSNHGFIKLHHVLGMILVAGIGSNALAQSTDAPPPISSIPATQPGARSLDDLLDIEEDVSEPAGAHEAATRENDEELKRQLNEEEIADSFTQAIAKMSLSAELLDVKFDAGLGTQRVQEDIIAKLNLLIDQAKKSSSKSSKTSSSSSSGKPQPNQQQQNPGQQQGKQQNAGNQRNNNPSNSGEGDPPAMQQGDVNTMIEETRSEWGSLPQRVRDMMVQGRQGKFSSLYQRLTEEYYKRLAEEGTP